MEAQCHTIVSLESLIEQERRRLESGDYQTATRLQLSGAEVRSLMRRHRLTIREMAKANQITQKRIRQVRTEGLSGFRASEWHCMITGQWLDDGPVV